MVEVLVQADGPLKRCVLGSSEDAMSKPAQVNIEVRKAGQGSLFHEPDGAQYASTLQFRDILLVDGEARPAWLSSCPFDTK